MNMPFPSRGQVVPELRFCPEPYWGLCKHNLRSENRRYVHGHVLRLAVPVFFSLDCENYPMVKLSYLSEQGLILWN